MTGLIRTVVLTAASTIAIGAAATASAQEVPVACRGDVTEDRIECGDGAETTGDDSTAYGDANFVSVKAVAGSFAVSGGSNGKDYGRDATVTVNGSTAQTSGLTVSYRTGNFDVDFDLDGAFNLAGSTSFSRS